MRLLGAEVIKIEAPGRGDAMRYYGPDRRYDGMAPAFIAVNAGKKSIALDLKDPGDAATARSIVEHCDVLVENFRPGVMARLGFGFDAVKKLRSDIVYCSVSGYGQSGPLRDWPAIDNIVQATSGMMSLGASPATRLHGSAFPRSTRSRDRPRHSRSSPRCCGGAHGDRDAQFIDVAMFDASLAFMASAVVPFLVTGKALAAHGAGGLQRATHVGSVPCSGRPSRVARCRAAAPVRASRHAARSSALAHRSPLRERAGTARSPAALVAELDAVFATRPASHWESVLSEAGVPCGRVREVGEAISLPHLEGRKLKLPLSVPGIDTPVSVVNAGFCLSGDGPHVSSPPPRLDEHREEILRWLKAGSNTARGA